MSILGDNIKSLRTSWGLTQEELGKAIHVAYNTVAMYERSERIPKEDILQQIAYYFRITVDQLVSGDCSGTQLQLSPITSQKAISQIESTFPIICSESAMLDFDFAEGYRHTIRFWNSLKNMKGPVLESDISSALREYQKSLNQSSTIESAANILWLLFLKFILIEDTHNQRLGEAILNGKGTDKDFSKNYILQNNDSIDGQAEVRRKRYANRHHETMMQLIKRLKFSSYSALGDYYVALMYIYGVVSNDESKHMNQSIGSEMMSVLYELDNPYALSYIDSVFTLYELHEM